MKAAWEQESFCLRDDESGAGCSEEKDSTAAIVRKQRHTATGTHSNSTTNRIAGARYSFWGFR